MSVPSMVAPVPSDYMPPEGLDESGQAFWHHILETCPWVAASDIPVLTLLCEAVDRRRTLMDILARDGFVLVSPKTGYQYMNPAAGVLSNTEAQITKWMSLLGLSPADRGRLGLTEVRAASELDRLEAERSRRIPEAGLPAS
jgi:P27 family predicted phage terminase small subunit